MALTAEECRLARRSLELFGWRPSKGKRTADEAFTDSVPGLRDDPDLARYRGTESHLLSLLSLVRSHIDTFPKDSRIELIDPGLIRDSVAKCAEKTLSCYPELMRVQTMPAENQIKWTHELLSKWPEGQCRICGWLNLKVIPTFVWRSSRRPFQDYSDLFGALIHGTLGPLNKSFDKNGSTESFFQSSVKKCDMKKNGDMGLFEKEGMSELITLPSDSRLAPLWTVALGCLSILGVRPHLMSFLLRSTHTTMACAWLELLPRSIHTLALHFVDDSTVIYKAAIAAFKTRMTLDRCILTFYRPAGKFAEMVVEASKISRSLSLHGDLGKCPDIDPIFDSSTLVNIHLNQKGRNGHVFGTSFVRALGNWIKTAEDESRSLFFHTDSMATHDLLRLAKDISESKSLVKLHISGISTRTNEFLQRMFCGSTNAAFNKLFNFAHAPKIESQIATSLKELHVSICGGEMASALVKSGALSRLEELSVSCLTPRWADIIGSAKMDQLQNLILHRQKDASHDLRWETLNGQNLSVGCGCATLVQTLVSRQPLQNLSIAFQIVDRIDGTRVLNALDGCRSPPKLSTGTRNLLCKDDRSARLEIINRLSARRAACLVARANWMSISFLIAFLRANADNPLRFSGLTLAKTIFRPTSSLFKSTSTS